MASAKMKRGSPQKPKNYLRNFDAESSALELALHRRSRPLLYDLLDLTAYAGYTARFLSNHRIRAYLKNYHPDVLSKTEGFLADIARGIVPQKLPAGERTLILWSLPRAKEDLAELIKSCENEGPQLIRLRYSPSVIVIDIHRWKRMIQLYPHLEELFCASKLRPRRQEQP